MLRCVLAVFRVINNSKKNIKQVQSGLGRGGIASRFYSPGGSSNMQLHVFVVGFDPKMSPSPRWSGTPSNTMCHCVKCAWRMASEFVKRFKYAGCANATDKR